MGLTDRFTGGGEPEVDYWVLRFRNHGSGDWMTPDVGDQDLDPERIDEEIPEDDLRHRAEIENWPPGVYQLMGRKKNAGFTGAAWTFEVEEGEDNTDRELTDEEKIDLAAERAARKLADRGPGIDTPSKAMGAIFEKTLDGAMPENVDMGKLAQFVDAWNAMTKTAPTSPDEVAGQLYTMQIAEGNVEAATALLGEWFAAQGTRQGGDSMLELIKESGDFDISMDTIKALGFLKFIDDPRGMMRETTSGLLEAQVGAMQPGARGQVGQGLRGLFESGGFAGDQEPATEDVQADESAPAEAGEPAPAEPSTGADLDLVAEPAPAPDEPPATDGAESVEDAPEPEADPEPPEPTPDATTGTQGGLDGALAEAEDQIDREAGEYPDATETMAALAGAADGDEEAE